MKATPTALPEVVLLDPTIFRDERGYFFESFNQQVFDDAIGRRVAFVQDNHSRSVKGVLRGLHYQLPPHAQGKLVRVTQGAVYDVAVDIRRSSATFGRWVGAELSADNFRQMWIPPGFAHGFVALTDSAEFLYKTTDVWVKACDRAIRWDDPELAIDWLLPAADPLVAAKDRAAPLLRDADLFD
jgi:dTDP-4-dehydrorhamnose 3,5-epimerase